MKTSCITHPSGDPMLVIHAWQMRACDDEPCAAMLLSLFEFYHNLKVSQQTQSKKLNEVAEAHGDMASSILDYFSGTLKKNSKSTFLASMALKVYEMLCNYLLTKDTLASTPILIHGIILTAHAIFFSILSLYTISLSNINIRHYCRMHQAKMPHRQAKMPDQLLCFLLRLLL